MRCDSGSTRAGSRRFCGRCSGCLSFASRARRSSLFLVAALHLGSAARDRASRWILAGVAVSVLAAGVQASGFAPHRHFNHNDLYHVIQIAAMILFYAGAKRLRDRS